jgi:hypothetical protein
MAQRFKYFLLNEEKSYLGHRIGDVMSAMQDVQNDLPNLGSRHLVKIGEDLVNQIRKILHGHWSAKNKKHLVELQKIAVAIMKTIDEKGDLKEILPAATAALQQISGKIGVKINNLDAPDATPGQDATGADFQQTQPDQQPQGPPPGMMGGMGGGMPGQPGMM